ncbi:MAG: ArsR/SmtB family transcription factor [Streptosporangiaceae bacterium]
MNADFAAIARLLASPARSAIAGALMDGRAMTAGELARLSGVAASTASEHLAELTTGGLVRVSNQGRHRYFSLASTEVGEALEAFARICPVLPVRSLRASSEAEALRFARLCYDHLAGDLGVALLATLIARGWLEPAEADYQVTACGEAGLAALDVDVTALRAQRRHFARPCLDWTARRPHLAGALGAAITASLLSRHWIEHGTRRRGLRLTSTGRAGLRDVVGLDGSLMDTAASADGHRATAEMRPGRPQTGAGLRVALEDVPPPDDRLAVDIATALALVSSEARDQWSIPGAG